MMQNVEPRYCSMITVSLTKRGMMVPHAVVITIAATKGEATAQALKELNPFTQDDSRPDIKDLGFVMYPPIPTTVFLVTNDAGRIK